MKKIVLVIGLITILLTACGSSVKVNQMNASEFSKKIQEPRIEVLDVRTPGEYSAGHISGAINIDVEAGTFNSEISRLDKTKSYAIYCHSGRRSMIAANAMTKLGFKNLFNLQNGINDWIASGGPIVQ